MNNNIKRNRLFHRIRQIVKPLEVKTKSGEFTFGISEYKDEGIIAYVEERKRQRITFIPLKQLMLYLAGTATDQIIELRKYGIAESISFYDD